MVSACDACGCACQEAHGCCKDDEEWTFFDAMIDPAEDQPCSALESYPDMYLPGARNYVSCRIVVNAE